MTNAELIKRLRDVPCWAIGTETEETMLDAADALEAADKLIAELEAQLPKEGKWIDETDTYRCRRKKYDINTKSCFVPKICKVEKNQRLVEHIMEFDAQGKEYDWYEQHIAMIADGKRKDGERDGET